jgi:hypothetical protein
MALFPPGCVLRGISACGAPNVRLGEIPCAALPDKKIAHSGIGKIIVVPTIIDGYKFDGYANHPS